MYVENQSKVYYAPTLTYFMIIRDLILLKHFLKLWGIFCLPFLLPFPCFFFFFSVFITVNTVKNSVKGCVLDKCLEKTVEVGSEYSGQW